jgi:hypothetical protein
MEQAINAYQKITVAPEFREKERLRSLARHNEASAIHEAEERGRDGEREKWRGVVDGKDAEITNQAAEIANKTTEITNQAAEIEKLRLQLAELQAKTGG